MAEAVIDISAEDEKAGAGGPAAEGKKEGKEGEAGPEEGEGGEEEDEEEDEEEAAVETPELFSVQHLRLCKHAFDSLVKDHSTAIGKALSKRQRESGKLRDVRLTYSEIRFETFAIVLKKCRSKHGGLQKRGGVFYDLGSGLGKALFAALMVFEFDRCTGIEQLDMLHDGARELADKWDRTKDGNAFLTEGQRQTEVDLVNEDFLSDHVTLADAKMVFMNSTCYGEDMMLKIAAKCEKMAPETWVITHTKRLPSVHFDVLEECRLMQSWGECTVFIHRKKPTDWQEVRLEREREEREMRRKEEEIEAEQQRLEQAEIDGDDEV